MAKILKYVVSMLLLCLPAAAQYQRAFGWCEQGGQSVFTNGIQSANTVQQSYAACTVTVYNTGTTTLATLYQDSGHTTLLVNPFTASSTGFWAFYAANATYDVQFSGAGIVTPFTIAGYSLGGSGGGGGGSVGPGTTNNVAKFTSTTNVGNATCTDDGITPMACGLGVNLSHNALFTVKTNNTITGTTTNLLVARDASGNAQNAQPTDTNNVIGVAGFGAGTSGSVSIAYSGQFPCLFDNQTAIGDWVTLGSASKCHDAGATEPSGIENMGRVSTVNAGAGTLAGVDWGLPDSTNTSSGGGTGVVGNCANAGALAYYPATGNTTGCPNGATVDGSGNITALSFIGSGTGAGYLVSQNGTAPTLSLANSNYLYADTTVATTFGTALPSAPGSLNQVLVVSAVPDSTHIKLGYANPSAVGIGGINQQVQFNDSGFFGGNAALTFNKSTGVTQATNLLTEATPIIDPRSAAFGGCGGLNAESSTVQTACWQAAIAQMESAGGTIYCAGGTVWTLNRVALSGRDTIIGGNNADNAGCKIFVASDAAFVSATPNSYLADITISDLSFVNGSNQIDLALINQAVIQNLVLQNFSGCGIVMVDGEQHLIHSIFDAHNGSTVGFSPICVGDRTKSLFSASITPGTYGCARCIIYDIRDEGTSPTGYDAWAFWSGGNGVAESQMWGFTCFYSCSTGLLQFGSTGNTSMVDSSLDGIDADHVAESLSAEPIAINLPGTSVASTINSFDACRNGLNATTEMSIVAYTNFTVSNSCFLNTVDNSSTFGLVLGSGIGSLVSDQGGLFETSPATNATNIAIIGSAMAPSNALGNQSNVPSMYSEQNAPCTTGVASVDLLCPDSTAHRFLMNNNNGGAFRVAGILKATSSAFATATTAGTCVQSTTAVTGATTAMVAHASPVSTPGVGAVWSAFVSSAGNVTINECAVATSAGGSIAFNITVEN